jgi:hypothetical protein
MRNAELIVNLKNESKKLNDLLEIKSEDFKTQCEENLSKFEEELKGKFDCHKNQKRILHKKLSEIKNSQN